MNETLLKEQIKKALQQSLNQFENQGHSKSAPATRMIDYLSRKNPFHTETSQLEGNQSQNDAVHSEHANNDKNAAETSFLQRLCDSTPARIAVGRTGPRPLTDTLLSFRADHAAAVDAVFGELDQQILLEFGIFPVQTMAFDKQTYIRRPDLGRRLTTESVNEIKKMCTKRPQVQIVVSDGLSSEAIAVNLRDIYPSLLQSLQQYGLKVGTSFYVSKARVAVMDEIGELLQPEVLVLLIGERPGLLASDSMSAYLCYKPDRNTVEADRMVVSNIHKGGTPPVEAGAHLGTLVKRILEMQASGVKLANQP